MFSSERQRARACEALLCSLPKFRRKLADYWSDDRPTELFLDSVTKGPLSKGERILLCCVLDFWNGEGGTKFDAVIYNLDPRRAEAVLSLGLALQVGARAIDEWIDEWTAEEA